MFVYLYHIKFADGSSTIAVGQEDHANKSSITEIYTSNPQWVEDESSVDDIIKTIKQKMQEPRIIN